MLFMIYFWLFFIARIPAMMPVKAVKTPDGRIDERTRLPVVLFLYCCTQVYRTTLFNIMPWEQNPISSANFIFTTATFKQLLTVLYTRNMS